MEVGECMNDLISLVNFCSVAFCYSHVEGHSTVFGTGLNYTALRLLGVDKDHPVCIKARAKLHQLGKLRLHYLSSLAINLDVS